MEEDGVDTIDAKESKAAVVVMATIRTKRAGATKRTHAEMRNLRIVNESGARNGTKENVKNLDHQ